ncbi:MAG: methyltransferase domain-containing protein [Myxococcota bacterium]
MAILDKLRSAYRSQVPYAWRDNYRYRAIRQFFWNRRLRSEFGVQQTKHARELSYWRARFEEEGTLQNAHYESIFLAIAGEQGREFISNRIIADFGSGPRGSLEWAKEARTRICIDVLSTQYGQFGIGYHEAVYISNTESRIPLPSDYVDVMFTLNALDHVDDLPASCDEIFRVIKPGGLFVASFNLHQPRTFAEPQTLTESELDRRLLHRFNIDSKKTGPRSETSATYAHMNNENGRPLQPGEDGFLWIRATKPIR